MLKSLGLILIFGMAAGWSCSKLKLPPLTGMLLTGIVIGPFCLNLLDASILQISADIRRIALIIILFRAGLNLKLEDLRKTGRSAVLMCFVPAVFEIIGMVLFAPLFFHLSRIESLLLGTVVAAVSPAVVVPHMLKVMKSGYGVKQGIPQMILAGASADDVFVIVLFTSFLSAAKGDGFHPSVLMRIPTSILFGILCGAGCGYLLCRLLKKVHLGAIKSTLVFLSFSFFLVTLEDQMTGVIGFSGLIAIMAMGMMVQKEDKNSAVLLAGQFSKLWTGSEIMLFVLVGAAVDIQYAFHAGVRSLLLVFLVLLFRMAGVAVCVFKAELTLKEKFFCMIAYTPKATVQAAIGAIPLSQGLSSGNTILTTAVTAILVTAPLGAFLIDRTYQKWLRLDLPD